MVAAILCHCFSQRGKTTLTRFFLVRVVLSESKSGLVPIQKFLIFCRNSFFKTVATVTIRLTQLVPAMESGGLSQPSSQTAAGMSLALMEPPEESPSTVMKISCECDEYGLLPADIEPAILDRNPSGLCEVCQEVPATDICTVGALREFARPNDALAVCSECHHVLHVVCFETHSKKAAQKAHTK